METFRSNPFCTRFVRPGSLDYHFCDSAMDNDRHLLGILNSLKQCRAGAILGPHGTGKTTLLHSLGPLLQDAFENTASVQLFAPHTPGFFSRFEHSRRMASTINLQQARLPDGGLMIIDGAEQLWRIDRFRLLQRARRRDQTILVTSHTPIRGTKVLHQSQVDSTLIRQLTESLLTNAPPEVSNLVHQKLREQDLNQRSNVRDLWFELYDLVQPQHLDVK